MFAKAPRFSLSQPLVKQSEVRSVERFACWIALHIPDEKEGLCHVEGHVQPHPHTQLKVVGLQCRCGVCQACNRCCSSASNSLADCILCMHWPCCPRPLLQEWWASFPGHCHTVVSLLIWYDAMMLSSCRPQSHSAGLEVCSRVDLGSLSAADNSEEQFGPMRLMPDLSYVEKAVQVPEPRFAHRLVERDAYIKGCTLDCARVLGLVQQAVHIQQFLHMAERVLPCDDAEVMPT